MNQTIQDFKKFVSGGNLVAIAVGILMGIEFGKIISSFVDNIFTPIFAMIGGKPDFSQVAILTINDAEFRFGAFITAVINFVIVAAVAFVIIKGCSKMLKEEDAGPSEVDLLTEIRDSLKK